MRSLRTCVAIRRVPKNQWTPCETEIDLLVAIRHPTHPSALSMIEEERVGTDGATQSAGDTAGEACGLIARSAVRNPEFWRERVDRGRRWRNHCF
jgi:hypothetical protein